MNPEDFHANEDDEYLTRVVIDTCARTFTCIQMKVERENSM